MSGGKDLRKLLRTLRALGWKTERRKGGHYCLTAPDGVQVFTGSTASDWRALKNLRARLRRMGVDA